MLVNQSLIIGLVIFVLVVSAFTVAWLILIQHDAQKYWNHLYGIYVALGVGFLTTIAFFFQHRFGDFENVYFFSGMAYHLWTTSVCVFYGSFFGFEYFTSGRRQSASFMVPFLVSSILLSSSPASAAWVFGASGALWLRRFCSASSTSPPSGRSISFIRRFIPSIMRR
jgi:hypothetical protein